MLAVGYLLSVLYSVAWIVWFRTTSEFCATFTCARTIDINVDPEAFVRAGGAMEAAGLPVVVAVVGYLPAMMLLGTALTLLAPFAGIAAWPWIHDRPVRVAAGAVGVLVVVAFAAAVAGMGALEWFSSVTD